MTNYVQRARAALARAGSTEAADGPPESDRAREISEKSETSPLSALISSLNSLRSPFGQLKKSLSASAYVDEDGIVERTAIIEVEAGVPRVWADAVARLCVMPRPASIPENNLRQLVDDAVCFVECHGTEATTAGWTTLDMFGVDASRPLARFDQAGAIALLHGAEVVRITPEKIVLRRNDSKNELSLYRRLVDREPRALLWDLT